ncbi:hypothetical protein ACFY97_07110 [Streptomyces klenkii]|uniref:hypothetical protein n=1 Tax=Streptomyces klenkii TaxID=1420899 RepID=UPI0036E12A58
MLPCRGPHPLVEGIYTLPRYRDTQTPPENPGTGTNAAPTTSPSPRAWTFSPTSG